MTTAQPDARRHAPTSWPQFCGSPTGSHPLRSHSDWDRARPVRSGDPCSCGRPRQADPEGEIMRKAVFELTLAWMLIFGGSGSLLRRA